MSILLALSVLSFALWLHAVILRMYKKDSSYNKYVFCVAIVLYLLCNFIQTQTFHHKTIFNLLFVLYSLFSIPFHIWLMISGTPAKDPTLRRHKK
ncbi:hypothetical protein BSK52_00385 [Paenibacillus odorifer]|uniref:Uncharacterized protein n=1 Tax=Paenibacillus odorifer TaxID=189426 RepID=A0A1R0Y9K1_9BACL|nr:hypothetical protein BSK52_00385 [Paenibacillus odorifer]